MNWEAIGAVSEALGAIGVIATLGYLGIQIRQNSLMIRANIRQARSDSAVQLHALGATSQIAEILAKENRGESLTDVEEQRLNLWYISIWRAQQTIFFQTIEELLDDNTSLEQANIVNRIMERESSRRWWGNAKGSLDSRFAAWVDEQLQQG